MHESQSGSKWRRWIIPADLNDNRALEIRRLSVVPRFRLFSRCTFYSRINFPSCLADRYDVTSRSVRSWTRATYGERKWPLDHLNATGFARTYLRKFASVLRNGEECWRGDLKGLTRHMEEICSRFIMTDNFVDDAETIVKAILFISSDRKVLETRASMLKIHKAKSEKIYRKK